MSDRFRARHRTLNDAETSAIADIKAAATMLEAAIDAAKALDLEGTRGRDFALATTKLEETVMWAVKGVTA